MLLIATCSVYAWILTYENLPNMLADNFFNLIQSKWAFLLHPQRASCWSSACSST